MKSTTKGRESGQILAFSEEFAPQHAWTVWSVPSGPAFCKTKLKRANATKLHNNINWTPVWYDRGRDSMAYTVAHLETVEKFPRENLVDEIY